jgi:protein phosphatase 1L
MVLFIVLLPVLPLSGTTCLVALLSDKELTVANVGDSRGVLCDKDGNAIALSHDHKPYQLKERKRIKKAGEQKDIP